MGDVCPVCLEELDGTASAAVECGHRFHVRCLIRFVRHDVRCPVCRAPSIDVPATAPDDEDQRVVLFLESARTQWRRYAARRRRVLHRRPELQRDFSELRAVRAGINQTASALQRVYDERCREVWRSDPVLVAHKRALTTMRRRHRRLELRLHEELHEAVGPEPVLEVTLGGRGGT